MAVAYSPIHPAISWSRSSLRYTRVPPRVKRTHTANQMKRVQGDLSPWRSLGRGRSAASTFCPSVLPAENTSTPICLLKNALIPRRRLRSPRSFVLCRDRRQKTHKPEVNQQSPITEPTIQERTTGDLDPRRNRNEAYRSPSCLALASSSKREPNAISGIPQPPGAAMKPPTPRRTAPARTHASAGTISGRHKRRAGAQFTPI